MFKMKEVHELKLQTPETTKFVGSTKNKQTKQRMAKRCAVMKWLQWFYHNCNLVDNKYQQKSEVLYTFTPNNSCGYLLNIELWKY